jgi:hypothetical protein
MVSADPALRMRFAWVVVLLACGERAVPGDDESGTSVDATSTTTGDAPSCEELLSDPDIGPSVDVIVRSESGATIWLDSQGCFFSPVLELASGGQSVPFYADDSIPGCDQYVESLVCDAGGNDCGEAFAGRMEPGSETESGWNGARIVDTVVDPACSPMPECPAMCQRRAAAETGVYEVSITAYRTCSGTCECDDPFEVCAIWGPVELGDPITVTAMIDYPTQTTAELVITDG